MMSLKVHYVLGILHSLLHLILKITLQGIYNRTSHKRKQKFREVSKLHLNL